jgi:DNA-directed RNA polymerase subunit N (RpoN/RPB10)
MTDSPFFCVTCGRKIESEWYVPSNRIKQLYCSTRCARRQQETLKRLRETTPTESDAHDIPA